MLNKVLYPIFLIFALFFLATMHMSPYPFDFVVKTIPIVCLAVLAFTNIAGIKGVLIAVNRFLVPVPLSGYLIMITYYLAQFSITVGSLKQCAPR